MPTLPLAYHLNSLLHTFLAGGIGFSFCYPGDVFFFVGIAKFIEYGFCFGVLAEQVIKIFGGNQRSFFGFALFWRYRACCFGAILICGQIREDKIFEDMIRWQIFQAGNTAETAHCLFFIATL
jgi:hypothetical protein